MLSRVLPSGGDVFSWSIPIARVAGIRVAVHVFFVLWLIIEFAQSLGSGAAAGPGPTAMWLGSLFGLVLVHEFGHCIACRRVGGDADSILLWPLGGLAMCRPPHDWRADLITTLGGPFVHVLLWPILAAAVTLTKAGDLLINPLDPFATFATGGGLFAWFFYSTYVLNILLFLFNMLLPMYPMDAGRVVQGLLWRSLGYRRSKEVATTMGMVVAGVLLLATLSIEGMPRMMIGLALFAGITCWIERQQLRTMDQPFEPAGGWRPGPVDRGPGAGLYNFERREQEDGRVSARQRAAARSIERARERELSEAKARQDELDRILSKIKSAGMDSLTRKERDFLRKDTQSRRDGELG